MVEGCIPSAPGAGAMTYGVMMCVTGTSMSNTVLQTPHLVEHTASLAAVAATW